MKRLFLSALLCSLLSLNASTAPVGHQATVDAVYKQQQTFVTGLIKHCKERLPVIVDAEVAHKSTLLALDELNAFANLHPNALECVIDTFQTCIDESCMDVPARVNECIQNYKSTEKAISLPDTQALQEKVNNLVVSYFKFQLTLLGALDHYGQQFLYRTQLMTYIELAKPWIAFFAVYMAINASLGLLEKLLQVNTATELLADKTTTPETILDNLAAVAPEATIPETITKAIFPHIEFAGNALKTCANDALSELNKSSLTKAVVAGLFTPNVAPSVEKINKYVKENWSKSYAELISKARKSGYPAKPSKESFDTMRGYENTKLFMTPVMDFCMNLDEYRAADLKLARGYLFEGPLADGRKMAFAVAGEMTKKLKALGSPVKWLTYEIHGSSLVNRKLDKVLEECLEFGPTVLIITNIDWIYNQKDVEPEVYADIINRLTRYLSQESNFPLLICATTQDHTVIDPVMLEFHKFDLVPLS